MTVLKKEKKQGYKATKYKETKKLTNQTTKRNKE